MYSSRWGHIAFLIAAAFLVIRGAVRNQPDMLYFAWLMFLVWDVAFLYHDQLSDRNARTVLDHIAQARVNMSWYIAVYAASIAYLATQPALAKEFMKLAGDSQLGVWLPIVPLVAASFAVLFIPIRMSGAKVTVATPAVQSMFGLCVFLQKVAITGFVYSAIRLTWHFANSESTG